MARGSYVHGNSGAPLIGATIGDFLKAVAASHGAQEALIVPEQGVRWTYAELLERSDAFAAGLLSLGLRPGDRVGIWAPNCAEWTVAQFATARAGLILVTINPAYRTGELAGELGAPTAPRDLGLDESKLDEAARIAAAAPYWDPRPIDEVAIRLLLDDAFHGRRPQH